MIYLSLFLWAGLDTIVISQAVAEEGTLEVVVRKGVEEGEAHLISSTLLSPTTKVLKKETARLILLLLFFLLLQTARPVSI